VSGVFPSGAAVLVEGTKRCSSSSRVQRW